MGKGVQHVQGCAFASSTVEVHFNTFVLCSLCVLQADFCNILPYTCRYRLQQLIPLAYHFHSRGYNNNTPTTTKYETLMITRFHTSEDVSIGRATHENCSMIA